MKIIGLTGGIGSGKTTVAKMFEDLGVPVYIADIEAKLLMNRSKVIRRKLIKLFGDKAYNDEGLNKVFIATKIFNDKLLLEHMNAIVHPKVAKHFERWSKKQDADYVIKEAAIIFEHNKELEYDAVILITAEINERIERILKRDETTKEKIMSIIQNQLSDEDKIARADYIITNNNLQSTKSQVLNTHNTILEKSE